MLERVARCACLSHIEAGGLSLRSLCLAALGAMLFWLNKKGTCCSLFLVSATDHFAFPNDQMHELTIR
jgi:hypothetical protein